MKHIVIVGGGPAGCMAAIACKTKYPENRVTVVEGNDHIGMKLRLTGGGRCNLTARVSVEEIIRHTPRNGRFLYSSLSQFNPQSIIDFFEDRDVKLKEEDHQRMFPVSDKALDVVEVLINEMSKLGVQIRYNTRITAINPQHRRLLSNQTAIDFDHLILAMGGCSYPQTGSDYTGFNLISSLGHTILELKPAEVPLVSNAPLIQSKSLQGLSFKDVSITAYVNNHKIIQIKHDLLITHFGLSGPGALQISSYLTDAFKQENKVHIHIDFLPNMKLDDVSALMKVSEVSLISYGIPKRLITVLKEHFLTQDIAPLLKKLEIELHGTRGFTSAFVTAGGVSLKEIYPKTLRSKLHPWLSICGESLDVNSLTGGYNMTVAFSTGFSAGSNIDS